MGSPINWLRNELSPLARSLIVSVIVRAPVKSIPLLSVSDFNYY
ncbi:hypothetical protein [Geminocystis sp. GBBB08]|nr:hypothetical protein [Geminocystis sp. GBBB08]